MNQADELQERTNRFALRVIKLCRVLARIPGEGWAIRDQLVRSGTAVAANYRATCRARSLQEFASRLGVVVEETDETVFWLELIARAEIIPALRLQPLINEAHELLRIFAASRTTTLTKIRNQKSKIGN
jgi:four helix bundle protein